MAKKQNQGQKASQGASSLNINRQRQTTAPASTPVKQAPYPEAFKNNPPPVAARYIPGLMVPGNQGYDPTTGGGGWAAGLSEYDGPQYNSVNFIKDWYKHKAFTGGQMGGSRADIEWAARQYDAGNLGAAAGAQPAASAAAPSATPAKKDYSGVKSIMGGLRIGGDNVLGSREARRISRATGQDYDKVLSKALGSGFSLGAGAVNRSNRAYNSSGYNKFMDMMTGGDGLSGIRNVKPSKGQMYSGTYELDGKTMPLIESRRGGTNPLGMGAGGGMNIGRGGRRGGRRGGAAGAADMGSNMGTIAASSSPMSDYMPFMMDEPLPESDININMPGVGEELSNWATGFKTRRSSRKRAGSQAQGLASQRVAPTGSWRYGT